MEIKFQVSGNAPTDFIWKWNSPNDNIGEQIKKGF